MPGFGFGFGFCKSPPFARGAAGPAIVISASSLAENSAQGTAIGTLSVVNGSGTYTFALTDNDGLRFQVAGVNGVNLQAGATATDREVDGAARNITVQADNGVDPVISRNIVIAITDVNEAFPVITSNGGGATAAINYAEHGTGAVTTVVATDPDATAVITYSISGGADAAKFAIDANTGVLTFVAPPDFENPTDVGANNTYEVIVQASDGTNTDTQTITVTVTDVADTDVTPPTITSSNAVNVAENATLAHALTANEAVTWSIVGGADQGRFELSGSTLRWLANGTKDFEAPDDADTNNTYVVIVRATDLASNTADQTVTVTVTDVDEVAPTITSSNAASVAENATLAHALTANEAVTWSIVGGADQARFELSGSTLRWLANGTKDFEAPDDADTNNTYVVTVRATDGASNTADQTITVTVTDVTEGGAYTASAVNFDGTNDYLVHSGGLTGAVDSSKFTLVFWVNPNADNLNQVMIGGHFSTGAGSNQRFRTRLTAQETFRIDAQNTSGVAILAIETTASSLAASSGWQCVLVSVDMTDTAKRHLYRGDTSDLTVMTYTNGTLDFDLANWVVGGAQSGVEKFNGDLADMMFWPGVYIDFSVEANRRLFIDAGGKPVNPDAGSGAIATLGAPAVRLTNPTATWHLDASGNANDFTENGALTDAATSPSD